MSQCKVAKILAQSVCLAAESGKLIRTIFKNGNLGIVDKGGLKNYQTEADRAVERLIVASIKHEFPDVRVIGEEGEDAHAHDAAVIITQKCSEVLGKNFPTGSIEIEENDICMWVDPLDGTAEFVDGLLHHVTVLIGIAVNGKALGGVIHQPFYGFDDKAKSPADWGRSIWGYVGLGAFGPFQQKPLSADSVTVTTTRSHSTKTVTDCLEAMKPDNILRQGGAGNKVLRVIEGDAHCYLFPSSGTKKWDTCAPEAILVAMGGCLTDIHGNELNYLPGVKFPNAGGVMATTCPERHQWFLSKVPSNVKEQLPP